jgi:hypothetical protein
MDDLCEVCTRCMIKFARLEELLDPDLGNAWEDMPLLGVRSQHARYKIWCGNLGSLQRGQSSLDARLRDSRIARAAFLKVLEDLESALQAGQFKSVNDM